MIMSFLQTRYLIEEKTPVTVYRLVSYSSVKQIFFAIFYVTPYTKIKLRIENFMNWDLFDCFKLCNTASVPFK